CKHLHVQPPLPSCRIQEQGSRVRNSVLFLAPARLLLRFHSADLIRVSHINTYEPPPTIIIPRNTQLLNVMQVSCLMQQNQRITSPSGSGISSFSAVLSSYVSTSNT